MTKFKHTPGPWLEIITEEYAGHAWLEILVPQPNEYSINQYPVQVEATKNDYKLIKAAPKLLEVVMAMATFDGRNNNSALKAMARSAIAEVTGQPL